VSERDFARLMMSIDNRESIKFSAFISNIYSFMAVLFNSCKVASLLGQEDLTDYVKVSLSLFCMAMSFAMGKYTQKM